MPIIFIQDLKRVCCINVNSNGQLEELLKENANENVIIKLEKETEIMQK